MFIGGVISLINELKISFWILSAIVRLHDNGTVHNNLRLSNKDNDIFLHISRCSASSAIIDNIFSVLESVLVLNLLNIV